MLYENIDAGRISDESLPWLPLGLGSEAQIKYFKCDSIRGEVISLLKAPSTTELPRHHHSGTVIVYTLKGKWKYKEHDWVAGPGSVVYETAASTHTPEAVPEGGPEIITLNIITGDLVFYDESDNVITTSNWRTSLNHYLDHCRKEGIEPIDITAFR
jgi:2,4'-dihydroxyacetophenone dioxygenase